MGFEGAEAQCIDSAQGERAVMTKFIRFQIDHLYIWEALNYSYRRIWELLLRNVEQQT